MFAWLESCRHSYAVAFPSPLKLPPKVSLMKKVVWGLVLLLVVLHQDIWNWDNDRLVFGIIPVTLAYHSCISIAASIVWLIAATTAWPEHLEDESEPSEAVR